nr:MAG TPA: hypothetical protein [Bacteriophage sp.]
MKSSNNSRRRGCPPDHYRRRFYGWNIPKIKKRRSPG